MTPPESIPLRSGPATLRGVAKPPVTVTDQPGDIIIDRDVDTAIRDRTVLRVNVFRTHGDRQRPAILSIHPDGKDNPATRRGKRWKYSRQYRVLR